MVDIGSNFVKILARRTNASTFHQLLRCSSPVMGFRHIKTAPDNCAQAVFAQKQQPTILYSALCLQRQAIIIPPKTQMEELFTDLMLKLEDEGSKLSDHELRHKKDLEKAESMRRGEENKQDDDGYVTAMDAVDAWEAELNKFTFPQSANDLPLSSAIRRMDRKLFFIGKQSLGTQSHWCFPQVELQSGESLRDAAEKLLQETVGVMKFNFVGNAPIGVHKYFFSKDGEHIPVKVFFHRVEILEDFLSLSKLVPASEHMWLTSEELSKHLPKRYAKVVKRFLLDL